MDREVLFAKANRTLKVGRKKSAKAGPITGELNLFLRNVAWPAMRNVSIPDAFEQIAPDIVRHCRIESLTAGVMKVKVQAGPYMFELRSRREQIIEELRHLCPSSNIREIRLVCSE